MKDNKFDIVIPAAGKDIGFLQKVIPFIERNLDCNFIYVITNIKNFSKIDKWKAKYSKLKVIDENQLICNLSYNIVKQILYAHGESRVGWYFQQLLKYGFAKSEWASEYYLTWDADTIPLNHIPFFDEGKPLFTKKIEFHSPYFDTMNRLLGYGKLVDFSFIAEHMLFKSSIVKELLNTIEKSSVTGNNWVEKIVNACDFNDKRGNLFSEFETYGNFCVHTYPELYKTRTLNTFRSAGLIRGRYINKHILELLHSSYKMHLFLIIFNISY